MRAEQDRVEAAWTTIEAWYAEQGASHLLHPPAGPDQVAAVEAALDVTLPEPWRASLLRHDGTDEGGWPTGELLSTQRIVDETNVWRKLLDGGTFEDSASDRGDDGEALAPGWWNRGWICLDADGAGNGAAVDLEPGPEGSVGQVIDMDHEVGPSGPMADDVAAYLERVVDSLDGYRLVDGEYLEEVDDDGGDSGGRAGPMLRMVRPGIELDDGQIFDVQLVDPDDHEARDALVAQGWSVDEEFEHHLGRARAMMMVGGHDEAAVERLSEHLGETFARAVRPFERDPSGAALLELMVDIYADASDYAAMGQAAERLVLLSPDDPSPYALFRAGEASYELGDHERGLGFIEAAYVLEGEDAFENEDEKWRAMLVERGVVTDE